MQEALLHFIWLYQYFERQSLTTTNGVAVQVLKPGGYNRDQGPDFLNARVKIGPLEWNGHVELHIRSSDWDRHRHQTDAHYDNVVLHVVWEHDREVKRKDGTNIPTLELKSRVDHTMPMAYKRLIDSGHNIPCRNLLPSVSGLIRFSALDQAVMVRLEQKAGFVKALLEQCGQSWEEAAYRLLARNFGFKKNSTPFLHLAQQLPYNLLRKHADNHLQIEGLLFGQAGMLIGGSRDPYVGKLHTEYGFLKHKYGLKTTVIPSHWKFLRLRPANFPTLRIAQFAALLYKHPNFFSVLLKVEQLRDVYKLLAAETSPYWKTHYRFGTKISRSVPAMGKDSMNNVLINTLVPLWVAYGKFSDDQSYINKALTILEAVPTEKNSIIRSFDEVGWSARNAFDSQAMIGLYNTCCSQKGCLNCPVGVSLLKPQAHS